MFIKNLQGDVIALLDVSGKVVVEYSYNAVVKYETTLGIGYYSHLSVPKVDDAATHRHVIFGKVEPITIAILSYFIDTYYVLLKNVDGVEYNGNYIILQSVFPDSSLDCFTCQLNMFRHSLDTKEKTIL